LTAINGSATTFMRSDGAPALSQSIVPTWTGNHTFNALVMFGPGATNLLYRSDDTPGGSLNYSNGAPNPNLIFRNGFGNTATFGLQAGGNASIDGSTGVIYFQKQTIHKGRFSFETDNAIDYGDSNGYGRDMYSKGTHYFYKQGSGGVNLQRVGLGMTATNNFEMIALSDITPDIDFTLTPQGAGAVILSRPAGFKLSAAYLNTTAGTTATTNVMAGRVRISAASQSYFITNNLITANSMVLATVNSADATALSAQAIPSAGLLELKLNAVCTANTDISWQMFKP
jgi:hypothetical protein